jgi:hypothetical protein
MSVIPANQKAEVGGLMFDAAPSKSVRHNLKNKLKAKGLGQVVECLSSQ